MRQTLRRASALALTALIACAGCEPEIPRPDIILVSIDTLRADRLGAYGYDRPTSPSLDAFAAKGLLYERAIAECSWTLPSHVTMLSGLFPSTHAIVKPALRIGADTPLLAEHLAAAGYTTIGLTDGGYVGSSHGFDRGFDVYAEDDDTFTETVADAIARMEAQPAGDPLFLFLHTYDVHCPYDPSPEYAAMFESPDARFIETKGRCGNPDFNTMVLRRGQREHISNQYDGSVREADAALETLFTHLESTGRLDRTVVLITSDHGEELDEHGQFGHERTLYRESLVIPFVLVAPDLPPGRVREAVGLCDVTPTLLQLAGLPDPEGVEGRRLLSADGNGGWAPVALADAPRYSELDRHVTLRSVMTTDHHLILNPRASRSELYSVPDDPLEAHDLAPGTPAIVSALSDSIARYERARTPRSADTLPSLSDEERARLRSLGYVN